MARLLCGESTDETTDGCDRSGITRPIHVYPHTAGRGQSVVGGYVYRGQAIPALVGTYVFADYYNGDIWRLKRNGTTGEWQKATLLASNVRLAGFGESDGAELFAVDLESGTLYRLT